MTMFVPLGESDPIKRLHKMQQHLDIMKRSTLPVAATLLTNGVMGLVPRAFASLVDETAKLTESAILSNMAGPKKFYDLAGYPVRDTFWATGQIIDRNCTNTNYDQSKILNFEIILFLYFRCIHEYIFWRRKGTIGRDGTCRADRIRSEGSKLYRFVFPRVGNYENFSAKLRRQ